MPTDIEGKDFLISMDTENSKQQSSTSSVDNNNQYKICGIDSKVQRYRNLQPLNSDSTNPDVPVTPTIEEIAKVNQDPVSCYQEKNEDGVNESEPESENSRLLAPDLNEESKDPGLILPPGSIGPDRKIPGYKPDPNQSRYKADPTRPRVHENLTYV